MNFSRPIETEAEYRQLLKRIDELLVPYPVEGSAEFEELDRLGKLAWDYEEVHDPIKPPDSSE